MARPPRTSLIDVPQHVVQRGNNRQICFVNDEDFGVYRKWLGDAAKRYSVDIHAWVFMTNHVHLLVTPRQEQAVSAMMQTLGRRYVRYFNKAYQRTGTLWGGRFKSCVVHSEAYVICCQRYIELNPVRARMVTRPEAYRWSSYHAHARGIATDLWTPHDQYLALGDTPSARLLAYRELFQEQLSEQEINSIRDSTNRGMALGNDRFRSEIAALTGIRQRPLKPGPKGRGTGEVK
ncbi:MAG: transposase [Anaerolineaceae bacterium]|nr:transposase [Anaerolineaceae bacterium]